MSRIGPSRRHPRLALPAFGLGLLLVAVIPGPALAAGKPGYPDRLVWGGLTWSVKSSRSAVGPGPCVFSAANASVDASGALHLRIASDPKGSWTCAEIIGPTSYGYGTYTFTLASRVGALDPNVVLGLFTWSDRARYAHREIDIEFARWGIAADPTNGQYVVQPADGVGHLARFTQPDLATSVQRFTWAPGRITWQTLDGSGTLVASYAYAGKDVPIPGDERVRLNLWLFGGSPPTDVQPVEVVVRSFAFTP